jgi:hypothetical protein
MSVGLLSLIVLAVAVAGYILGRRRAIAAAGGDDIAEGDLESYPRRPSRSYLGTYSEYM